MRRESAKPSVPASSVPAVAQAPPASPSAASDDDDDESEEEYSNRNVQAVVLGDEYEFDAWYDCPVLYELVPDFHVGHMIDYLFVCNRCFKHSIAGYTMAAHLIACKGTFETPGQLVYQNNQYSIRMVDGAAYKLFCQCLCIFAKLFLDTKSILFAVDRFEFYVAFHHTAPNVEQAVGFFSKEKISFDEYNLACILVFPPFQHLGIGHLLIDFSYQLSILDGVLGSPERPLSERGRATYLRYWAASIVRAITPLVTSGRQPRAMTPFALSIDDISRATGIRQDDVIDALRSMDALVKLTSTVTPAKDGLDALNAAAQDDGSWAISSPALDRWSASHAQQLAWMMWIDINSIML
ncbi:acyl-CoA N-acyltransferase [Limtongia smithiae]|uniref:acyl-CoA N-acyltransferase n=1 Tax=Limtongia smithiae TaxID=1125753 RepID=UPI0034CE4F9F